VLPEGLAAAHDGPLQAPNQLAHSVGVLVGCWLQLDAMMAAQLWQQVLVVPDGTTAPGVPGRASAA